MNVGVLLSVFLVLILSGALIWTYESYIPKKLASFENDTVASHPFLNPARKFFSQKDLIVNIQPLRDELNEIGKDQNVSVYFEYLSTGANISVNKDNQYFPASLIKLPLAMAVVKKIEKGEWKWQNELVLMSQDKDSKFGNLYKEPIGTKITIEELVRLALQESDNTAYLMLLRNLEPAEFDDVKNHLGLQEFFSADGNITAKNYSVLLRSLFNATYLNDNDSEKLLNILTETSFNDYIASGIPNNTKFAHKIGISEEENVLLDAGIVYLPNRPYILIVMTKSYGKEDASQKMKDISQKVYDYVSNYKDE